MIRSCGKTGVRTLIPVFVCLIGIKLMLATPARVLFAAPPDEKLPELSKPQLHREKTVLEKAVDQAAAMLLQGKLPPTEDGVRFALWLYGEKGDVAYRDVATRMAREFVKTDAVTGCTALYRIAQAGGSTLNEALKISRERDDPLFGPERVLERLALVSATRDPKLASMFGHWTSIDTHLCARVLLLRMYMEITQASIDLTGQRPDTTEMAETYANAAIRYCAEIIQDDFWDKESNRFIDKAAPDYMTHVENDQAALAMWEAGVLVGDEKLREEGRGALEADLEAALGDTNATATAGLAAARMSRHPVQIAIIGDPRDSTIAALRQEAYFLFEPNKIILNLDPKKDSKRMAGLMYSPEAAPAMFVCVETLCSPPIKDPAELEKQVAEIKKLAAQVEQ